jgi:CRP-like cAMP-binding protein
MLSTLERILVLRTVSIFSEIDDDELSVLAPLVREVEVAAGEPVITEGEIGTTLFVIVSGRVRVHLGDRLIVERGDRTVFGELSALDAEPRSASITAMEDTLLFTLEQEALYELMSEHVELARGIIRVLCQRLRAMVDR